MKKKIIKRKRLLRSFFGHHLVALASYELLVMASLAVLLFMSIALGTSHATDGSAFYFRARQPLVQNWAGQWGAYVSSIVFYWCGYASYAILAVSWALWIQLIRHRLSSWQQASCALFALASGFFMWAASLDHVLSSAALSGVLGSSFASWEIPVAGFVGAFIGGAAFIWLGVCILYEVPVSLHLKNAAVWAVPQVVLLFKASTGYLSFVLKAAMLSIKKGASKLRDAVRPAAYEKPTYEVFAASTITPTSPSIPEPAVMMAPVQEEMPQEVESVVTVSIAKRAVELGRFNLVLLPQAVVESALPKQIEEPKQKRAARYKLPETHSFKVSEEYSEQAQKTLAEAQEKGKALQEKLSHFGIKGQLVGILPGPVITLFEYAPDIDSKLSKIIALEDDLALALKAMSIRILAPIPGKNVVGFEIAHENRQAVSWAALANSDAFTKTSQKLPLILGVDIAGRPAIEDLATMPHLLIAGATGAGKSVAMHSLLASLLCSKSPDELRLVLIDPKRLEFASYADIGHLLFPIVTQPRLAIKVLAWLVTEMERRYELMAKTGARNIVDYRDENGNKLPFIAVMIDELADLMMTAGKEVEHNLVRLAQMARASGIHLIVATQRPSVDVVTGLIKVNFPSRIAFRVSSKIDSRTIIDAGGAEKLLGRGDLLFMHPSQAHLRRLHGAFIAEEQIKSIVDHIRAQRAPDYISFDLVEKAAQGTSDADEHDELYDEIKNYIKTLDEISISMLQRQYRIGFNRSARIIEKLEMDGMLAPAVGAKPRKIIRG